MKKNSLKITITALILLAGVSSCKHSCAGYDNTDKSIIPFSPKDTITYISDTGETLKLLVHKVYHEETKTWKGSSSGIDCQPKAYYEAADSQSDITLKELHNWDITVTFCKDAPYQFHLRISEEADNFKCRHLKNREIGGKVYASVWQLEDLSGKRRIDKIRKTAYHGIIEFHDKNTGRTWTQWVK